MESGTNANETSVRVAVRIRPLLGSERVQECRECVRRESLTQIVLGDQRLFSYDFCFGQGTQQSEMYEKCIDPLLASFIQGFNSTVMAYGQTGSGKSHTMGTESTGLSTPAEEKGIVPRVIHALFKHIQDNSSPTLEYTVRCSFLEIYNEDLRDLLDQANPFKSISIRETPNGEVVPFGIVERVVHNAQELLTCLEDGSVHRSTGSTLMNAHSSRSHAIFSVSLTQRRVVAAPAIENVEDAADSAQEQAEFITSKFSFVDLAGSERLKKTGAVGERRREGININCGLLALGNVISALGDPNRKGSHVPFRDSKITRLLQDSLGGNSKTLMVACVSPADVHFEETLNTLRYAARARNIINKPIIGRDPNSKKLELYRQRIMQLESALAKFGIDASTVTGTADDPFAPDKDTASSMPVETKDDLCAQINELRAENAVLDAEVLRLMEVVKVDRRTLADVVSREREAITQKNAIHNLLQTVAYQVEESGSVNPETCAEISQLLEAGVSESPVVHATTVDKDHIGSSITPDIPVSETDTQVAFSRASTTEPQVLPNTDSSFACLNEVDELEVIKKRKDREFRRMNEQNARTLRRFDADIDHKSALIEQLLKSKQQAETLRQRYEAKIAEMETRVRMTQQERDKVLNSISLSKTSSQEEVDAVKAEFQSKLVSLTVQLQDLRRKYKENERILRSRPREESQIVALREDISRIKKQRVALQRQMKDEADKHRCWMIEHQRQVAGLQKQLRKDTVEIGRMHAKLHQQGLVMKIKTERANVLQRELSDVKRRMTGLTKKAGSRGTSTVNINVKSAVRRLVSAAVQAREMAVQKERLEQRQRELIAELEHATSGQEAQDSVDPEVAETVDNVRTQLEFVKSKLSEIDSASRRMAPSKRRGKNQADTSFFGDEVLQRIGVPPDNPANLRGLAVYLINQAVGQRANRTAHRRRIDELESEIMQLQSENESLAARLEVVQRESDRRLMTVEKDHVREVQAILGTDLDDENVKSERDSIRELETQLSQAKLQQSRLLSPIAEHPPPPRRSRRIVRMQGLDESSISELPPRPGSRSSKKPATAPAPEASTPYRRVQAGDDDCDSTPAECWTPSMQSTGEKRNVLDRLTDTSLFTGTSRYPVRRSRKQFSPDAPQDEDVNPNRLVPESSSESSKYSFDRAKFEGSVR
ncbi:Kinesin motor domain-containing protein [Plasmodiophora brassicae]